MTSEAATSLPGVRDMPRAILLGAAALIGFAIVSVDVGRVVDVGTVHMPAAKAVETLSLRFEDQADGGVGVRDAADGTLISTLAPGTNGFIRGTLRGLARERKLSGVDGFPPFTLIHWNDGTLSLEDKATGRRVNLDAFGPTNSGAFAQLFSARRSAS